MQLLWEQQEFLYSRFSRQHYCPLLLINSFLYLAHPFLFLYQKRWTLGFTFTFSFSFRFWGLFGFFLPLFGPSFCGPFFRVSFFGFDLLSWIPLLRLSLVPLVSNYPISTVLKVDVSLPLQKL